MVGIQYLTSFNNNYLYYTKLMQDEPHFSAHFLECLMFVNWSFISLGLNITISLASSRGSLYYGRAIACVIRLCVGRFVLNRIILGLEHKPKQVSTFFIKEINEKKKETQF